MVVSAIASTPHIICITILTFTLLTRQTLYELRFRDGDKEVAALMACTSR
ncbi:type I toxin-antitoxin system Hok family toxin [Shigella sonnei]|nr:type I toxin-antitoxin system Hok family toxin [Shigella sonnei]